MSHGELVYVSGRCVPREEAHISALDAGVLLGAGLFETLRAYAGKPFRLPQHLARLRKRGVLPHLRPGVRRPNRRDRRRLVEANGVAEARVRLTATRGPLADAVEDDEAPPATLIITAGPMTPYPAELYQTGATVVVSDIRASTDDPTVYHKTTGYLKNLLALRNAHRARRPRPSSSTPRAVWPRAQSRTSSSSPTVGS